MSRPSLDELRIDRPPEPGGGGSARQPTGLEAQIEQQISQLAQQAEIRASAEAIQAGQSTQDAFRVGRETARATEARLRAQVERGHEDVVPAGDPGELRRYRVGCVDGHGQVSSGDSLQAQARRSPLRA